MLLTFFFFFSLFFFSNNNFITYLRFFEPRRKRASGNTIDAIRNQRAHVVCFRVLGIDRARS